MNGDIVPLPRRDDAIESQPSSAEPETIEAQLAVVQYRLDTADSVPLRSRQEILKETLLLVPNLSKLLFRLLKDKRVSRKRRLAMTLVGAYVASPIDLVPDFIPVLGTLDDLLVLAFAVDYLLDAAPPGVVEEHWDGSEDALELVRGLAGWSAEILPERLRRLANRVGS
jgi:uncharacterized membrane protein YkvA (DUF1232 family)